jgi:hypothetical protein
MGGDDGETMESCMTREKKVQAILFGMKDFKNWAEHASSDDDNKETFTGWRHKSIADVTSDEVAELMAP